MTQSVLGSLAARRAVTLPLPTAVEADTVDLSSEFPSGSTFPALRETAIDAIEQHLCDHYTRRPGIAPLCRAVATSMTDAGVPLDENLVTICGGVAEARYVAVRALAAGKPVYLPAPAPTVYAAGLAFGEASQQIFDPNEDLPAVDGGVLIVANPNPVTGQVSDPGLLRKLAAWAATANLTVIADESVGPVRPEAPFLRFASLPETATRTLTLGSFAEVPGLGAWHVSWIAGPKPVFTPVRDLKQSITICTAAPSQYAALAAAEVDEGEIEAQYAERLEAILGLLEHHQIAYLEPDTVAFVVALVGDSNAAAAACAASGLLIGNGALLGNPGTIRIGVPSGSLGNALEALDNAFHVLKGTRP